MKIEELDCPALLRLGILTLDDGTAIDMGTLYWALFELREYAVSSTLEGDDLPDFVVETGKLLEQFQ